MSRHSFCLLPLLFLAAAIVAPPSPTTLGQDAANVDVVIPSKEQFRIVLLAGQSNMAGRGIVEEADRRPIPRVYMLDKTGEWVPATDPVHYDKPSAGVGPGREFARLLTETDPTIAVGLVPTACGGSSVDDWQPGIYFAQTKSHPYDDAVARTRRALEDGVLEAILWRQGESDTSADKAEQHAEKLLELFTRFRSEFNAPEVPILVGELVMPKGGKGAETVRNAQITVVSQTQPAAFVSAEGTTLNSDNVHFDRKSQIEQGKRFFNALQELKRAGTLDK